MGAGGGRSSPDLFYATSTMATLRCSHWPTKGHPGSQSPRERGRFLPVRVWRGTQVPLSHPSLTFAGFLMRRSSAAQAAAIQLRPRVGTQRPCSTDGGDAESVTDGADSGG